MAISGIVIGEVCDLVGFFYFIHLFYFILFSFIFWFGLVLDFSAARLSLAWSFW